MKRIATKTTATKKKKKKKTTRRSRRRRKENKNVMIKTTIRITLIETKNNDDAKPK